MNFQELLKEVKEQKANGAKTMHNQTEIISGAVPQLQRHEMKAFKASSCIFFKELQIPFNPVEPTDPDYNSRHKFIVKGAPSMFVKIIKEEMSKNKELHSYYAGLIKKTAEEYDVSDFDTVTDDDFAIFNKFTVPAHYSADTQKIKTSAAGKFGMERMSPLEIDEDGGIPNADQYLIGRLYMLEREIRNEKVAEYMVGKDKNSLNSDEKERLVALNSSMQIKYPKKSGVILFLEFEGKEDKDTSEFVPNPVDTNASFDTYIRYYNCNSDELKKIFKKIGKKKIDKYLDYIILKVEYGDGNDPKTTTELALYKSREYNGVDFDTVEDPHNIYNSEDFDKNLTTYIDEGLTDKFDRMVRKSVWKFRSITDDELRELYIPRLAEIEPYITQNTLITFGGEIEAISPVIKKHLDEAAADGTIRKSAKQIVSNDNTMLEIGTAIDKLDELNKLDSEDDEVIDQDVATGEDLSSILKN